MTRKGTETRPNIVLITSHDLGRQLGCYGWDVETPNLDEMAAAGVQFDSAFCTAPQCSPSRASVTTGQFPHRNGMMGLAHCGWSLHDERRALPWHLNDVEYETHLFGFQHETDWSHPERLGYRAIHRGDDGQGHPPGRACDVADRFAETLDDVGDDPFFAALGFVEPHMPFRREYVPEEAYERYDPEAIDPLPHLEFEDDDALTEHCESLADFRSLITATVDPAVGIVRDALEAHDLAGDTVLIFTTDHGEPESFDRAKTTCYDPGLRIALLVEAPGRFALQGRCETLVSNVDLFPTILDLADAPVPNDIDGRSVRPLLEGDEYDRRDRIFAEQTWHGECKPTRAIRTDRYKYIRNFRPYSERRPGFGDGVPAEEFFDLREDPHERRNLLGTDGTVPAAHEAAFERIRTGLVDWMQRTDDPLADGCIPIPHTNRLAGVAAIGAEVDETPGADHDRV